MVICNKYDQRIQHVKARTDIRIGVYVPDVTHELGTYSVFVKKIGTQVYGIGPYRVYDQCECHTDLKAGIHFDAFACINFKIEINAEKGYKNEPEIVRNDEKIDKRCFVIKGAVYDVPVSVLPFFKGGKPEHIKRSVKNEQYSFVVLYIIFDLLKHTAVLW